MATILAVAYRNRRVKWLADVGWQPQGKRTMLTAALKRQFDRAFDVLEAAIESFTADQWVRGSPPFDGPARAVAHALLCGERYTADDESIHQKFGQPVSQMSNTDLPTQQQLKEYAVEVRRKTLAWIDSMGDDGLGPLYPGDPSKTGLDQVVYALRHLQHHTGEACAYQKQCGLEPARWK